MDYIELWTCKDGVKRLSRNIHFYAWEQENFVDEQVLIKVETTSATLGKFGDCYYINPNGVVEIAGHIIVTKPTFIVGEPYLNYFDVINYLQKKYKITNRGKKEFLNWISNDSMNDFHNGCFIYLSINPLTFYKNYYIGDIEDFNDAYPNVIEIITFLWNEYRKESLKFYLSW